MCPNYTRKVPKEAEHGPSNCKMLFNCPTKGLPVALSRTLMLTPITKHGSSGSRSVTPSKKPCICQRKECWRSCLVVLYLWEKKQRLNLLVGPCLPGSWTLYLLVMKRIQLGSVPDKDAIPDFGRPGHSSSIPRSCLCSLSPPEERLECDLSGACTRSPCPHCAVLKILSEL